MPFLLQNPIPCCESANHCRLFFFWSLQNLTLWTSPVFPNIFILFSPGHHTLLVLFKFNEPPSQVPYTGGLCPWSSAFPSIHSLGDLIQAIHCFNCYPHKASQISSSYQNFLLTFRTIHPTVFYPLLWRCLSSILNSTYPKGTPSSSSMNTPISSSHIFHHRKAPLSKNMPGYPSPKL